MVRSRFDTSSCSCAGCLRQPRRELRSAQWWRRSRTVRDEGLEIEAEAIEVLLQGDQRRRQRLARDRRLDIGHEQDPLFGQPCGKHAVGVGYLLQVMQFDAAGGISEDPFLNDALDLGVL